MSPRARIMMLFIALVAPLLITANAGALTLWPTYHLDPGRSGNDTTEPTTATESMAWATSALDGAVYAEPLVDGSDVIVVTENDSVYAFNAGSGTKVWGPVSLGTPRTSSFPCGDIMPLGITGTPVIDGGALYVVAEVQSAPTSFAFHLAKLDPSTGSVSYNIDVTPSGMDANVQQERSALAVSNGNVVIAWGGLDGDCGDYHGYLETASESNGAVQNQWHSTPNGREGGIWATAGPLVAAGGNIIVATGNGSSTDVANYDYGDSVLEFTPALALLGFFAPGSPQPWTQLNGQDTDLGSLSPSFVTTQGSLMMFEIGKGGRGYLLNPANLPSTASPPGGEAFSAQVCNGKAFGGLAVSGTTVYVPCENGIAAVSVDTTTAFHTLWYQTSGGGAPPILAGGVVWTAAMYGGTTLYGLRPSDGTILFRQALPATTQHFASPSAGAGDVFLGDGNRLVSISSGDLFGQYSSSAQYGGEPHDFFYDSTAKALEHVWYSNGWNVETLDGSAAAMGNGRTADDVGTDNATTVFAGGLHDFYADATGGLRHAWFDGSTWSFETLDGVGAPTGSGRTGDHVGTSNATVVFGGQLQVFYADTTAGTLRHAWWDGTQWSFETLDGHGTSGGGRAGSDTVGVSNSALVFGSQVQDFYGDATAGTLRHAWWDGRQWSFETLDGRGTSGGGRVGSDTVGVSSSALAYGAQVQEFYDDSTAGTLRHAWWDGVQWNFEALDGTGVSGPGRASTDTVGVANSAMLYGSSVQDFYADTTANTMRQAFWDGSRWNVLTLDGAGASGWTGQVPHSVGTFNAALMFSNGPHNFYFDATANTLRHAWWTGSAWFFETVP